MASESKNEIEGAKEQESGKTVTLEDLESFIGETKLRNENKLRIRNKNLEVAENRPDEAFLRKLDSNIKKNTAFIKKLKTITESQKASLVKDFGGLNLSKYVAEMASSLVEVKLKMSDVPTAVELCSLAHQRYADFSSHLLDQMKKALPRKKDEKPANPSKFRVDLRYFSELIAVGVISEKEGLPVLGAVLTNLVNSDKESHQNLAIVIAFCKFCGEEYAGLVPRKYRVAALERGLKIPKCDVFSSDRKKNVLNLLLDYYQSVVKRVTADRKEVKRMEKRNRRQFETKGEIHAEAKHAYDDAKSALDKLVQSACVLADLLDQDPPQIPTEEPVDEFVEASSGMIVQLDPTFRQRVEGDGSGLWEDEDTRQFYETLPELREMLPGILFKDSEEATLAPVEERIEEEDEVTKAEGEGEETAEEEEDEDVAEAVEEEDNEEAEHVTGSTLKLLMAAFVNRLPTLVNRDMIDSAAVDFVTNLNTKPNRRKLLRSLYEVPRTRLDLLPFYSRLVAILHPVMPDLGTELVQLLIGEFRAHVRKKNQLYMESKIRCCRFIGELTKFLIFPKSEALHCFKMLLFDFRHHNIDMACALMDSCGYFLFHCSDSHQKTKILLEQMMRKKNTVPSLDQRYHLLIENAFYTSNPPPAGSGPQKIERPPIHEYIRFLLFRELSKSSVEKVLKQMRKLKWTEEDTANYAIKCLSSPWLVKYSSVQWLASVLAGLMWYHDWVGHRVVDAILEDIRLGMEINHPKFNQRRVAAVKYLGEMYNFRVVDSGIIFNVFYSFVMFGVNYDAKIPSLIDPPEHLFRIRLSAVLLATCGEYFNHGSSKKKLDYFLAYLQRYYWMKKESSVFTEERPFPLEVDNVLSDVLEFLRPNMKPVASLQLAEKAVKDIEAEFKEKVESLLKFQAVDEQLMEEDIEDTADGLAPIEEGEEEEEEEGTPLQSQQSQTRADRETPTLVEDSGESGRSEEEEEEEIHVHLSKSNTDVEDKDFMAAFDQMMSENLQHRMQEAVPSGQTVITVPANVRAKLGRKTRFDVEEDEEENDEREKYEDDDEKEPMIKFMLMTKAKGNKPVLKQLKVSTSSDLARNWRDREEMEQKEKEEMKRLTLDRMKKMEEEELDEAKRSIQNAFQFPTRGSCQDPRRRPKNQQGFQHQRGAPMPKEIFSKTWN